MKTEKLVAALRCSSSVPSPQLDCRRCAFHVEETVDGRDYAGCDCDRMVVDAADRLEELVDRCARYAEEIAVLREQVKRVHGKPSVKMRTVQMTGYHEEMGICAEDGATLYRKKMTHVDVPYEYCPACGVTLCSRWNNYCGKCGTKMDRGAGNER